MAIYHFSGTVISRSSGKSAIASAAYRAGEKLHDERQEKVFDYGHKQDVMHKEIMLPEGAPEWMQDREKLWNAVERVENRKDAQLAREIHFSLPRELSYEQNIELAREFVKNEFIARGMVADLCIHEGKTKDGEEQPHAHVMLTLREVTEEGFGLKERSWNAKENLLLWRESWAEHANKYLALNGIEQRIDHRSNLDRGIDLTPQNKIGPENLRVHELKAMEHQEIARKNGEKLLEDPGIALKAITYHQSTFTHQDLACFINRHTIDADQFQLVYEKVKNSEQVVVLGKDDGGRERLTTREMLEIEKGIFSNVDILKNRGEPCERDLGEGFYKSFEAKRDASSIVLSQQQQDGLKHIIGAGDIKCLVGYAGTGKSLLLGEAKEIWEKEGYRVHGVTLAGIAAESLEASSGIESRTFASREYFWDKGEEKLGKKDILVIDEAGMLGSRQIGRILEEVRKAGAKAVLLGDPEQLQAIEAGAIFRAILEYIGFLELTEVRRQQEPWQQEATKEFATGEIRAAIERYDSHGCLHLYDTQDEAKQAIVDTWNEVRIAEPDKTLIMLTYMRKDVSELNELARECRKQNHELGQDHVLETSAGNKTFAEGDRIYFLRNNRDLGVKNGTLGNIERIDGSKITVVVDRNSFRGNKEAGANRQNKQNKQEVNFDIKDYNYITHGYAGTIHKAQAITVDRSFVLFTNNFDKHLTYVGDTRHKESLEMFWSREEFRDKESLFYALARDRSKDVTLDYIYRDSDKISESAYFAGLDVDISRSMNIDGEGDSNSKGDSKEVVQGFNQEEFREKSVSELVEELAVLSKGHDEESEAQKQVRELRELTQSAEQSLEGQKYREEIKEYLKEHDRSEHENKRADIDLAELKAFKERYEREHPKDAEIARQEIAPYNSPQERRAEKLIERYYGFEERYHDLKERGGSRFSMSEAKDQMERCGHEICNDRHAMDYLQKNDRELFLEMNHMKELEKMHERERGFEMSL